MSVQRGQSFNQVLLEVIDDSLVVLGEEPRKAVYQYLVTLHSLEREKIPERTDEFVSGLKKALGAASSVIQRLILKKLYQRLGSVFHESQGLEFGDYIMDARRRFEVLKQHQTGYNDTLDSNRSKKGQFSG